MAKSTMEDIKNILSKTHETFSNPIDAKKLKRRWYESYFMKDGTVLILMCFFIEDTARTIVKIWTSTKGGIKNSSRWKESGEITAQIKQSTGITFKNHSKNHSIFYFSGSDHNVYRYDLKTKEAISIIKEKNPFAGLRNIEIVVLRFLKDDSALEIKYIAGFGKDRVELQMEIHNIWS